MSYDHRKIEPKWPLDSARGKQNYDHTKIERKWQKAWGKSGLCRAVDFARKPKRYILIEFPYPSGERLHVGHGRSYCCLDAVARLQRMKGYNVLFPFGWDAFGLPAENYAIRTGIHPSITTKENIATAKKQAQSWGLSFDWEREINTTDPDYYRWTQWIFLQFFKKGLAYKAEVPVNWCPSCKINLADEEVAASECERCSTPVERRMQSQWMLKITAYADRLINDLEKVDYRSDIKAQQINWIGRSEGTRIEFPLKLEVGNGKLDKEVGSGKSDIPHQRPASHVAPPTSISVFTTRADTLFGATFLVLSPEKAREYLNLVPKAKGEKQKVEAYIQEALKKSELQRQEETKEKTGVFTGVYAQHPITREKLPVWVADFVLSGYGTGAVMAVPAHDQRDFEFAKKYNLPVRKVIEPSGAEVRRDRRGETQNIPLEKAYEGEGELVNSAQFSGLQSKEASDKITQFLTARKLGQKSIDYKLHDWVFSRQHYWGEPIPIIYCRRCWEAKGERQKAKGREGLPSDLSAGVLTKEEALAPGLRSRSSFGGVGKEGYDYVRIDGKEHAIVPVSEEELPVELPYVENYKPTETGESPLAVVGKWVNVHCPICNSQARRETDTMPNWAGSSWYFLRYLDPDNDRKFADPKKIAYWMPIDWYNGGMEHNNLHLLYSRFWYKFLFDLKLVPGSEPYAKRTSHGVVLGPGGAKMSKSRGNVINPDEIVSEFGADTFRLYEAFIGPFEQMIAWDPKGVLGVRRFLNKVWKAHEKVSSQKSAASSRETQRALHQLIKKVEEDTMALKFNTAIAAMMGFINELASGNWKLETGDWKLFLQVLAPYAPHLTEELFYQLDPKPYTLDPKFSIHQQPWPKYDPEIIVEETVTIIVQVDGKLRGKLEVRAGEKEAEIAKLAREIPSVKPRLDGRKLAKTVFVPDNLINFVTR
ncbi:MAG: leucine--tRNA ligase [candidate division WWE3 bacterium]|nr:leucine--tRNA ligase [candidate division WWE3 bacterium]